MVNDSCACLGFSLSDKSGSIASSSLLFSLPDRGCSFVSSSLSVVYVTCQKPPHARNGKQTQQSSRWSHQSTLYRSSFEPSFDGKTTTQFAALGMYPPHYPCAVDRIAEPMPGQNAASGVCNRPVIGQSVKLNREHPALVLMPLPRSKGSWRSASWRTSVNQATTGRSRVFECVIDEVARCLNLP